MQMSPFEFVTVFLSLIIGFALAHILRATSDLYEIRERVKTYWLNSPVSYTHLTLPTIYSV